MKIEITQLTIRETHGIPRVEEPITMGIPFPKGLLYNSDFLALEDTQKKINTQKEILSLWGDGSIEWLLVDFLVNLNAHQKKTLHLFKHPEKQDAETNNPIRILQNEHRIQCKNYHFYIQPKSDAFLVQRELDNSVVSFSLELTNSYNNLCCARFDKISYETMGKVRNTIKLEGRFANCPLNVIMRIHIYLDTSLMKCELTIHNPQRVKHKNGLWDLGDQGSFYFRDIALKISLPKSETFLTKWRTNPIDTNCESTQDIRIYQDSSGSENWESINHVNHEGRIPLSFCGYKVYQDNTEVDSGKKCSPDFVAKGEKQQVAIALRHFWQNFPKCVEKIENNIYLRFFPQYFDDYFELQGGEQKTHTFFVDFASDLSWIHHPLIAELFPQYIEQCAHFPYFVACATETDNIIHEAIANKNSIINRREIIDEYGWRHFGEIYADHEAVNCKDNNSFISHYNNQYDFIYGAYLQYMRSNHHEWLQLMEELALHVIDIDIYRTNKDKSAYNGGLFWHTNHYLRAETATHRCYSQNHLAQVPHPQYYGGGPSNEHNYTTGLMYYYFITGNKIAKEAVIILANWVIDREDGRKNIIRFLSRGNTGLTSQTAEESYHGPGRGAGNSINALLDAHKITTEDKYLVQAEKLLQRCIHPEDNILEYCLDDPERRWSYTVFLQIVGKYLDHKEELGQRDYSYYYARKSLLHYAKWIVENEYFYLEKPEKLIYPTETWAAQEMRKVNVLLFAQKYSNDELLIPQFKEKAIYFCTKSRKKLQTFTTKTFVRPIAIIMLCGTMYEYFQKNKVESSQIQNSNYDFGKPQHFVPQKTIAKKRLKLLLIVFAIAVFLLFTILYLYK